ncbi:MAG: hypothetical protein U1E39_13710 [Planctomycetota bacterium]
MTAPNPNATGARWAVAALDHGTALLGYAAVPEVPPPGGGWRRLYLKPDAMPLAAVGSDDGAWASLGVELACPRDRLLARAVDLLAALAPYEVALDLDAGSARFDPDAVLRVALRLFVDGCHGGVVREAVGNVVEAAAAARKVLGITG